MGFFDRFKRVEERSREYTIDIRDDCFVINGIRLEIPIHIDALKKALGEPRAQRFIKQKNRPLNELIAGEPVTNRTNYFWDSLGLKAYTYNGSVVNTFAIQFIKADYENNKIGARTKFKGTVTINGGDWLPVVLAGEDKEVFREFAVGEYLINAEYTDFDQDDSARDETSFTGLEIQLKK